MKLGQSVVPYALNSQKRVTHSTIKVLHQPTSSECVTTFPCSLPSACPNDNEGKLQKVAMVLIADFLVTHDREGCPNFELAPPPSTVSIWFQTPNPHS